MTANMTTFRYFNWKSFRQKSDINQLVYICTLAKFRLKKVAPDKLNLLHEDRFIIAVDKPPNILSLPGKCTKPFFKPRYEQWRDAVCMAACGDFETPDSDLQRHLQRIEQLPSIPRKRIRFQRYISASLKIVDIQMQEMIWKRVSDADDFLNKQLFEDIPSDLVSTADLVEKYCGHKVFVVHRLDFETSGVILYAKTETCAADLCGQFRNREIEKTYYAVVANHVQSKFQVVCAPLRPDPSRPLHQIVDHVNGKDAETHVERVDHTDDLAGNSISDVRVLSYVKLMPLTGRSHQLRVHLSHIGHPILGDSIYAPSDVRKMRDRLCLHAQALTFTHPVTNNRMTINSSSCDFLPAGFEFS